MKQLLRRFFKDSSDTNQHHFLITSHGQTASMWLAAVLNCIPEIFCTHGYAYPPRPAKLEEITPDELTSREISAKRFETLSLDDFFSELRHATNKPIVGNVLAFYLGRLLSRVNKAKLKKRKFTLVNMIRHPVTRLTSTLKTWNPLDEDSSPAFTDLDFATRCNHFKDYILQAHQVDLTTHRNKSFVVALLAMEDITNDIRLAKLNHIPNIKYEDITTDKNYFGNFIQHISADRIKLSPDVLNSLFSSKRINAHNRRSNGEHEASRQFQLWEKWQQDAFKFAMERTNMLHVYEGYNYDFSFIK